MDCVSPTVNGKCVNRRCLGSKHCAEHRPRARKLYDKYKKAQEAVDSYDHESTLESEDTRVLLKYHHALTKARDGRSWHIDEFFHEKERDKGHGNKIKELSSKLQDVEKRLQYLYSKYVTSSSSEEDTEESQYEQSSSEASNEDPLNSPESEDVFAVEEQVPSNNEYDLLFDKIVSILSSKAKYNAKRQPQQMLSMYIESFVMCIVKCDRLGYFGARGLTIHECFRDSDNVFTPYGRFCGIDELKTAYRRMLFNLEETLWLHYSLFSWAFALTSVALTFRYKIIRMYTDSPFELVLYFSPTPGATRGVHQLVNGLKAALKRYSDEILVKLNLKAVVPIWCQNIVQNSGMSKYVQCFSKIGDGMWGVA